MNSKNRSNFNERSGSRKTETKNGNSSDKLCYNSSGTGIYRAIAVSIWVRNILHVWAYCF